MQSIANGVVIDALGETSGKTSGKIIELIRKEPNITIPKLSAIIGVTERSIERNLHNLQERGLIERIGPAKSGFWKVKQ